MAVAGNAQHRFKQLDGNRRTFLNKCELFAAYTLPKICPEDTITDNNRELSQDFQAVGAQCSNYLANKLMLALFAPSQPFFRLGPTKAMKKKLDELGAAEDDLQEVLSEAERQALKELDKRALRPKLYEAVKHLIVTGNVLCAVEDEFRVIGVKKFVVRRSTTGRVLELIIADKMLVDELEQDVQDFARRVLGGVEDREVTLYKWVKFQPNGDYTMTQWLDTYQLPAKFNGKWSEENLPYKVLTWDLADGQHYGTGLVEDYENDFTGLSALSRAQVQGAILASEFRWLVNPGGVTRVEDFENTPNGGALPGVEGDIVIVRSDKGSDLQITMTMAAEYVNRIGRGFLMGSQLIRDAERVTAEEIRLVANELETALGGAYSRIAVDFQLPMARWLLSKVDVPTSDGTFEPVIVTGLDALSRGADLDELKLWLADVAAINQLPPPALAELNLGEVYRALAVPRRIDVSKFLKTPEQKAQEQEAAMAAQAQQYATQAGVDVAAEQATNQEGNQ